MSLDDANARLRERSRIVALAAFASLLACRGEAPAVSPPPTPAASTSGGATTSEGASSVDARSPSNAPSADGGDVATPLLGVVDAGGGMPAMDAHDGGAARISCTSIDDCWLDGRGDAIARPRRLRGRPLPPGDCGTHLTWLRHRLSCDEGACISQKVGDKC